MEALLDTAQSAWVVVLLTVALLGGLILIPLGMPGLWIMLGAAVLHSFLVPDSGIGVVTLVGCTVFVVIAELLEFSLSGTYARKYGGSSRSAWGAIVGGFLGAFVGAFLGEMTVSRESRGTPHRVAFGALVGRAVATAVKVGVGIVIGIWIFTRALV